MTKGKTASGLPASLVRPVERSESSVALMRLPSAGRPVPAGWWREFVMPQVEQMDDPADVDEWKRQVAAVSKYVKDREQRFQLDAAARIAEMRIAALIGPPPGTGTRTDLSTFERFPIHPQDHWMFWTMFEHHDDVLRLIEDGVAARRRILAWIERQKQPRPSISGAIDLRLGDFREVLADVDGVDAIITDPPYPAEFLPLYSDLSTVAERVLRPGGILAAMVGHIHLPEVLNRLGESLSYRWVMAYLTGGAAAAVHARRLQTYWKPVVIFEKPPPNVNHRIGGDVIRSGGNDRDDTGHYWGQTESGMAALVERLTAAGDVVLDPFAGGGTTLAVCASLDRPCIGAEIDPVAYARARERLGV